jgi:hypothetical protein
VDRSSECGEALVSPVPEQPAARIKTLAVFQSPALTIARSRPLCLFLPPSLSLSLSLSLSKLPRAHSAHGRGPKASQSLELFP